MVLDAWHLTPEYINEHWTEEMLALLLKARLERWKWSQQPESQLPTPSEPHGFNDGRYRPEHHADVATLAGKMIGFGSTAFKITKR